jgi:hypothetical protein
VTGPEHYEAAETLVESAAVAVNQADDAHLLLPPAAAWALAAAQVHATLALAAATALQDVDLLPAHDADMWLTVAGTPCPPPLVTEDAHNNGGQS